MCNWTKPGLHILPFFIRDYLHPLQSRKNHRASRWDFPVNPAGLLIGTFGFSLQTLA